MTDIQIWLAFRAFRIALVILLLLTYLIGPFVNTAEAGDCPGGQVRWYIDGNGVCTSLNVLNGLNAACSQIIKANGWSLPDAYDNGKVIRCINANLQWMKKERTK